MSMSLYNKTELDFSSSTAINPPSTPTDLPVVLSPRLHNHDLAPTKAEGRRWGRYSIFALWTNDVHNIANYSFAMGLYAMGLGGWQILLSLGIGAALVYFFMNLSGYMGQKTGVPFPVMSRIAFGIHGAQLPALIRAVIAIASPKTCFDLMLSFSQIPHFFTPECQSCAKKCRTVNHLGDATPR